MIAPTPAAMAAMAAVVCPEQDGDFSPFGWIDGSELTPEGASGGHSSHQTAPEGVGGGIPLPSRLEAADGHVGPRSPDPTP